MLDNPVGTGPYLPEVVGSASGRVVAAPITFGGLGRFIGDLYIAVWKYIDYGTTLRPFVAARKLTGNRCQTSSVEGEFIEGFGTLEDWNQNEIATARTL